MLLDMQQAPRTGQAESMFLGCLVQSAPCQQGCEGIRHAKVAIRRLSNPTWHRLGLRQVPVGQVQPSGQRLLPLPVPAVARRRPQLPKLQPLHARLLLLLRLGLGLLLSWRWRLLLLGHTQPRLLWRAMTL